MWDISTYISFCPVTTSCLRNPERPRVILNDTVSTYEQVETTIEVDELDRRSDLFKALGDRNRLKLLYLLMDGEKCVSDLLPFFDILQPTVSIHLLMLQDLGLLKARRDGRRRYYSLASEDVLIQLDRFCERIDRAIPRK